MSDYRVVANTEDGIGEIPTWSEREQKLYWIDLLSPRMHRLDPASGEVTTWPTPEVFSAFAMREGGGFVVATRTSIAFFEPESGAFEPLCDPEPEPGVNFLNDGRCDRRGRFWVGSGNVDMDKPTGILYCFDPDRSVRIMDRGFCLSNSITWSPDNSIMYFCDSMRRELYTYDFDADSGAISNRRLFASVTERPGIPDGSMVDAQGYLWNAEFDMSAERTTGYVVRYNPEGGVDRVIELPTCRPTAVTFGGPNLDVLYVNTSRFRMTDAELARQPDAGALFAIDAGVTGLLEPRFGG